MQLHINTTDHKMYKGEDDVQYRSNVKVRAITEIYEISASFYFVTLSQNSFSQTVTLGQAVTQTHITVVNPQTPELNPPTPNHFSGRSAI